LSERVYPFTRIDAYLIIVVEEELGIENGR